MAVSCCQSQEIPRVSASALSPAQFHAEYFLRARPVIITDAAEDWPARSWTIPGYDAQDLKARHNPKVAPIPCWQTCWERMRPDRRLPTAGGSCSSQH